MRANEHESDPEGGLNRTRTDGHAVWLGAQETAVTARPAFDSRINSDQVSACGTGIGTGERRAAGTLAGGRWPDPGPPSTCTRRPAQPLTWSLFQHADPE